MNEDMGLLNELLGGMQPPSPTAGTPLPQVQNPLMDSILAQGHGLAPPAESGRLKTRNMVKGFVGDFLFSLAEGMKASASAPGRRGTMAGMGAALQAPMLLQAAQQQQAVQAQEMELRQRSQEANIQQSDAATELSKLNAQIALMKEQREGGKQPEAYTLSPGQARFEGGKQVAGVPERTPPPAKPEKPTESEYLRTLAFQVYATKKNKTPEQLTPEEQQSALAEQRKVLSTTDEDLSKRLAEMRLEMLERQKGLELTPRQQSSVLSLSDDFVRDSKNFVIVRDSYDTIQTASRTPDDPAAQLALIFAYMKMLDPGSTVREGEFANAENTAGVPERIRNMYNNSIRGTRIGSDQVKSFTGQAKAQYQTALNKQKRTEGNYRNKARIMGVPADAVVSDLSSMEGEAAPAAVNPYRKK